MIVIIIIRRVLKLGTRSAEEYHVRDVAFVREPDQDGYRADLWGRT